MHRTTLLFFVFLLSLSCRPDSERSRAKKVNEEKFGHRTEKEARFVIDVIDASYGVIDLAKMAENKLSNRAGKHQIQKIIVSQTSAMVKLKAFAEERGIEVPLTGPVKSSSGIKKLRDASPGKFDEEWMKQMKQLQHKLKRDIESYQRKSADADLVHVLDTALLIVKDNNHIISSIENNIKESI